MSSFGVYIGDSCFSLSAVSLLGYWDPLCLRRPRDCSRTMLNLWQLWKNPHYCTREHGAKRGARHLCPATGQQSKDAQEASINRQLPIPNATFGVGLNYCSKNGEKPSSNPYHNLNRNLTRIFCSHLRTLPMHSSSGPSLQDFLRGFGPHEGGSGEEVQSADEGARELRGTRLTSLDVWGLTVERP